MVSRTTLLAAAATIALAAAFLAVGPAGAAVAADTTTTFTVSGGALGISAPASAVLGTGGAGTVITAQLGAVTVSDNRALLGGSWTATAALSAPFANTTTSGADDITTATYSSGAPTGTTGVATVTPGQTTTPATLNATPVTACSASATGGNNSATWNPTIAVSVPAQAIAGTYSGTITHSVS